MMNLFIDSNIWLDLYHFSSNDLKQFNKLKDMIGRDVNIFLNQQVIDEIYRNRENKINDAYKQFESINIQVPNLCKGYDEYEDLNSIIKEFKKIHKKLCMNIKKDTIAENLHADRVIKEIMDQLTKHEIFKYVKKAKLRFDIGNPPGKNKSYGDAINWEFLLDVVHLKEELFFISSDADFRSNMYDYKLNYFLFKEWTEIKQSKIFFYTSLNSFFSDHLKDINLETEKEKESIIEELESSSSFSQTHQIIGKLSCYSNFTNEQAFKILGAAKNNSQVGAIINDNDLAIFYKNVLKNRRELIKNDEFDEVLENLDLI